MDCQDDPGLTSPSVYPDRFAAWPGISGTLGAIMNQLAKSLKNELWPRSAGTGTPCGQGRPGTGTPAPS